MLRTILMQGMFFNGVMWHNYETGVHTLLPNWHETCITLVQFLNVHSRLISNILTCKFILRIYKCIYQHAQATTCNLSQFLYKRACAYVSMAHLHSHSRTLRRTTISLSINVAYFCVPYLLSYSLPLPRAFTFKECPA